ncbi:MAG: NAD-dependent epimerase/dehydratase family protein [Candidatus Uhrbacteria bacterium]|nr:NAD-dependent epimerase/dehydratase family protein [Candidatus Uhrbacteria bacterium]
MKFKTALVTGGAGFIGSHLVDALVTKRIKVYVVDDLSSGQKSNVNPNANFTKLSVNAPAFIDYLKKIKPDVIFHLAAQINVRKSVLNPIEDAKTNIMGLLAILSVAKEIGVKKIVFSSSGGVMYPDTAKMPYAETIPAQPISPYGISKRASEMYLAFAHQLHGVPYVALRYANVFGPRQNAKGEAGVISMFATAMLAGKPTMINGTGKQTRDFVYVGDIVRANLLAAQKNVVGEFNIGTGRETDINTLFKKLVKLTGYKLPEQHAKAAVGEVMRSVLDARKAREILDWEPKMKFDDGLAKTVEWFRKKN